MAPNITDATVKAAKREAYSRNRTALNDYGEPRFPVLQEADHPFREYLAEKWDPFIDAVPDDFGGDGSFDMAMTDDDVAGLGLEEWRMPSWRRCGMQTILEMQDRRLGDVKRQPKLLNEYSEAGLTEATTSAADVAVYTTAALPMVRRAWPREYVMDIVPFLAWTQATGFWFSMDFTYASSGETYAVDQRIDNVEDPDYTDSAGESAAINQMDMLIQRNDITTEALKILSQWSLEAQQDAQSYFGVNLDPELLRKQAMLMSRNKQRKIIEDLRTQATGGIETFDLTVPTTGTYSTIDPNIYKKTIFNPILDVDASIMGEVYLKTSWMVGDENVGNYIEETEAYSIDPIGDMRGNSRVSTTPNLNGVLRNRWDWYCDPFLVGNQIIMGTRGPTFLESMYTVLEFVPLFSLPLWQDPRDMTIYRSAMERFGRVMLRSNHLGRVDLFAT